MTRESIRKQVRKFAWGCNAWGDSLCPSLAAFPQKAGKELKLYGNPGLYDSLVQGFMGASEDEEDRRACNDEQGEISESLAKRKWLEALAELERHESNKTVAAEHRLVAEKLGWIETRVGAKTR